MREQTCPSYIWECEFQITGIQFAEEIEFISQQIYLFL